MIGEQAYQHALQRCAELRDELQKSPAYRELQEIEAFLALCQRFASAERNNPPPAAEAGSDEPAVQPGAVGAVMAHGQMIEVGGIALRSHMRKAMLDEGRPLSRVAAVQALNARGVRVAGSDQVVNVGTALWRAKDEFINLKPHGYWPRDVAYAPAGYHPSSMGSSDESRSEDDASAAGDHKPGANGPDSWSGG